MTERTIECKMKAINYAQIEVAEEVPGLLNEFWEAGGHRGEPVWAAPD